MSVKHSIRFISNSTNYSTIFDSWSKLVSGKY